MKTRILLLAVLVCLLFGGCGWMDGSYLSITPHRDPGISTQTNDRVAVNYLQLRTALERMVDAGVENAVINVAGYRRELLDDGIANAAQYTSTRYPLGAWAVDQISYEIGTGGGQPAISVAISYIHGRSEIRKIKKAEGMEQAEALIIEASFGNPKEHCDYMVVLGAKVRAEGPSVSLMDRIRATQAYMDSHPDAIAVVSGGKGDDEPITEAQCMYEELVKLGVDPQRIWIEDQATSTWENLNFSLNLIEEKTGTRPEKIGILSSEYHLFRASLFADACGVESVGIPAATSRLPQKINHFMREVAGVWHYLLLGGQYND